MHYLKEWLNEFEKLDLFKDKEMEQHDLEVLDRVFTSSTYDFFDRLYVLEARYTDTKYINEPLDAYEIPLMISEGNISLYRYRFVRPQEPTDEELKSMRKLGSFFSVRTGLLYWWLNKLVEQKGINVKRGYSGYLKVYDNNENEVFVKCGELLGKSLCQFMSNRHEPYNKLIVVPFVNKEEYKTIKEIEIYMIEYDPKYLKDFNRRVSERINESILKLQRGFLTD